MSKRDTCHHGRPECTCRQDGDARVAFEHDFVRLTTTARATHAFYQAGMHAEAHDWLVEMINLARGLRAALSPCDHEWRYEDGSLYCAKGCKDRRAVPDS